MSSTARITYIELVKRWVRAFVVNFKSGSRRTFEEARRAVWAAAGSEADFQDLADDLPFIEDENIKEKPFETLDS